LSADNATLLKQRGAMESSLLLEAAPKGQESEWVQIVEPRANDHSGLDQAKVSSLSQQVSVTVPTVTVPSVPEDLANQSTPLLLSKQAKALQTSGSSISVEQEGVDDFVAVNTESFRDRLKMWQNRTTGGK